MRSAIVYKRFTYVNVRTRPVLVILGCAICLVLLTFYLLAWDEWDDYRDYNFISFTEKINKKPYLVYLDKSGYVFADKQPNYFMPRNVATPLNRTSSNTLNYEQKVSRYESIEHDPNIVEDAVPQSYKWYLNRKQRITQCTSDNPAKNVVLLRSHQTGSHTIANIFYRYGENNNLFFALPHAPAFQYYWPLRFHHSYVDKTLYKTTPNLLINVARNNINGLKYFTSKDTYNIAIVRDPVLHFESIYDYVDMSFFMRSVTNDTNVFEGFAKDPSLNLRKVINYTKMFDPVFNLLHNGQLFDLGFDKEDYKTSTNLEFIVQELDDQLDLVLLAEYMDESLVLMQRLLCWQLSDVVYLKQRARKKKTQPLTIKTKVAITKWNKEDVFLYKHFNKTFWERIEDQDESFWENVNELKDIAQNVERECTRQDGPKKEERDERSSGNGIEPKHEQKITTNNIIPTSRSTSLDSNIKRLCNRLLLDEKRFIKNLKTKQKQTLSEENNILNKGKYLKKKKQEGNFYYLHKTEQNNETKKENDVEEELMEPKEILLNIN